MISFEKLFDGVKIQEIQNATIDKFFNHTKFDSNKVEKVSIDKRADMIYNFRAKVPFDESLLGLKNGYVKLTDNDRSDAKNLSQYNNYFESHLS